MISNGSSKRINELFSFMSEHELQTRENDLLVQHRFRDILDIGSEDTPVKSPGTSLEITLSPLLLSKYEKKQAKYPGLSEEKDKLLSILNVKTIVMSEILSMVKKKNSYFEDDEKSSLVLDSTISAISKFSEFTSDASSI